MARDFRWTPIRSSDGHQHQSGQPQGVLAGGFVFLSAVRGTNPATGQIETVDPEAQFRQALANAEAALRAAGTSLADVVRVVVYCCDLADRGAVNSVWAATFDPSPARLMVQVSDIGAPGDGSRFLLEVTAVAPS